MPVTAVRRGDVVVFAECRADADGDRLHPRVRVDGAADQLLLEELHRLRFEGADALHLKQAQLELLGARNGGLGGHYASSMIASTVSTFTSSPSSARMSAIMPLTG